MLCFSLGVWSGRLKAPLTEQNSTLGRVDLTHPMKAKLKVRLSEKMMVSALVISLEDWWGVMTVATTARSTETKKAADLVEELVCALVFGLAASLAVLLVELKAYMMVFSMEDKMA